jgi:hypothetical protein
MDKFFLSLQNSLLRLVGGTEELPTRELRQSDVQLQFIDKLF